MAQAPADAGRTALNEVPRFFYADAANYLRLPRSTVNFWATGPGPLIRPADARRRMLSFNNHVELHTLSSLRGEHGLSAQVIRKGLRYLKGKMGVERPLLDQAMSTDGKHIIVEYFGTLVGVSENGQLRIAQALDGYLKRVDRDENGFAVELFPFTVPYRARSGDGDARARRLISIDPAVCGGRPCIAGTRIATEVVAGRHRAGEMIEDLARDYRRPLAEIDEALRYESRSAA